MLVQKRKYLATIKQLFPPPIRISIPLILLAFGGVISIFSFQREITAHYKATEETAEDESASEAGEEEVEESAAEINYMDLSR